MLKYYKVALAVFILFKISCVHYISDYHGKIFSGKSIRDLSFFPINGLRFRLSELKDKKAIVLIMRNRDCLISEKHSLRLAHMETQYSILGIQFIYIYVGQLDSLNNGKEDLKQFGFRAPYVIDIKQTIVNALSVQTTSEVLILTPDRKLIYRGPLDDSHHLLKSVFKIKNKYVSDILDAIVSDRKFVLKEISSPGCIINRPLMKKKIFYKDVAPIISRKCSVCHNPSSSNFINYTTYEDIVKRHAIFKHVIENDLMPPWGIDPTTGPWRNDRDLTPKEKAMLLKWIDDGYLKKKRHFKPLWTSKRKRVKTTDSYIIHLPKKIEIPAEGLNEYKRFIIPTHFGKNKWISHVEFFTKPKVIHHILLFLVDDSFPYHKNLSLIKDIRDYAMNSFGVVSNQKNLWSSKNIKKYMRGYKLPKNSKLVLEIHYESSGQKMVDDYTYIKIIFHKKKPKYKIITHTLKTKNINIPPHQSNHQINMSYKLKKTRYFLGIFSHMHLRGKASSLYITNPKSIKQKIFGIDPYLTNFQTYYELEEPIKIMDGSIVECINWFDNSASNPANSGPEKYVTWGRFMENEMSDCHINFLIPADSNEKSRVYYSQ